MEHEVMPNPKVKAPGTTVASHNATSGPRMRPGEEPTLAPGNVNRQHQTPKHSPDKVSVVEPSNPAAVHHFAPQERETNSTSAISGEELESTSLAVGMRVRLSERCTSGTAKQLATISFVGETHFQTGLWVGVTLDEPLGKNDGSVMGRRYFECAPRHGIFIRPASLAPLEDSELRSVPSCDSNDGVNETGQVERE